MPVRDSNGRIPHRESKQTAKHTPSRATEEVSDEEVIFMSRSLPVPAQRHISSSTTGSMSEPLAEQSAGLRNSKATGMPAPVQKPKERISLMDRVSMNSAARTNGVPRPSSTVPVVRSRSATGLHQRTKSVTNTVTPAQAASLTRQRSLTSRPASVTGHRPTSSTSTSRPTSASGTRAAGDDAAAGAPAKKVRRAAWDTKGRLEDMESAYKELKEELKGVQSTAVVEKEGISSELQEQKQAVGDLQLQKQTLQRQFEQCNEQIGRLQGEAHIAAMEREQLVHRHAMAVEDERLQATRREQTLKLDFENREREFEQRLAEADSQKRQVESQLEEARREGAKLQTIIQELEGDLVRERKVVSTLKDQVAEQTTAGMSLQEFIKSLKNKIEVMEAEHADLTQTIRERDSQLDVSEQERRRLHADLITEETQRRILHNKIQELKGNIRVFCRVRPALAHEPADETAFRFDSESPDEIEVVGSTPEMSITGAQDKTYGFKFDKVFPPRSGNEDVFGEISQLVQSALDGYNVSIFAYGQTGSGKTHTMSAGDGMIPRAVAQIYQSANDLRSKGWEYTIEGSFLEIYCENMRDLLARSSSSANATASKLEIRHDDKRKTTTVEGLTTVPLDSASTVDEMLERAGKNRTIAATAANERSSRSHSVFMLALEGRNEGTGERSRGVLNLIDLAGSERLSHSQATGDRLKETQHINKSLSCLADVIHALGSDAGHVPYRNSKLTYLLQYSLGGNSKTLMFVNVAPSREHVGETLSSLRFATKVNATVIGTAKAQKR
ncbi:kinesin-like nuclear fusion protein [Savitreella phatthalungensis]